MNRASFYKAGIFAIGVGSAACVGFGGSALAQHAKNKTLAIITMVDTPQLVEVKNGVIAGMAAHGYVEGKNLKIDFKSAQSDFATAQQIARSFVSEQPDAIVSITTPASQAVVAATADIPIIFSTVTDPVGAKIVASIHHPGKNVTGVSDLVPTEKQLDLIKEIVPNLKTLGLLYDSAQDSSRSTVNSIKSFAPKMGFKVIEAPAMGLNNVAASAQSLVGRVDAIFVPNDTTVYAAFESVVKVAQDAHVPLFSAERRSVQRGSIGTVGYDFGNIGKKTADLVNDVFNGAKAGNLDVVYMKDVPNGLGMYLNPESAAKMGVTIPKSVLSRATQIF